MVVPHDQWIRIEITCRLGSGNYGLRVTVPDQSPEAFHDLPCVGGTAFRRCGWIGICSIARQKSVF